MHKRQAEANINYFGPSQNSTSQRLLLKPDFFVLDGGLEVSLNADGQNSLTVHTPQRGLSGVQTVCPNPTCSD